MDFLITAFHRPQDATNLIENFNRQNHPNKRLIIIENGPGIGTFNKSTLPNNIVLLKSENHQSHARNAGIEFIQNLNTSEENSWITFDSDDWYGSSYLTEQAWMCHMYPDALVSKRIIWVVSETMPAYLYRHRTPYWMHGACLGSCDLSMRQGCFDLRHGEDFDLCKRSSHRISTGMWNYKYIRNNYGREHTFNGTDYELLKSNAIPESFSKQFEHMRAAFNYGTIENLLQKKIK